MIQYRISYIVTFLQSFMTKIASKKTYLLPSITGRGMGVGLILLLLFAACSEDSPSEQEVHHLTPLYEW